MSVPEAPTRRVAIVVPALAARGGLASVALFLYRTMAGSRYEPHLVSVATSSTDEDSVRLLAPHTWGRGARLVPKRLGDLSYVHVGSVGAEIEPLRYRPRRALTELLDSFDIVQLVAGTPALAHVAREVRRPVALQCATMVSVERQALLKGRGPATAWRRLMTSVVARMDRSGLRHADVVLVENAWMHEAVARVVGRDRVRFTPPGVDTSIFHPDGARDGRFILAVGRLDDPRKNIAMLVRAFARATLGLPPDVRLVLAGERPPDERITRLAAELGVSDRIEVRLALPIEKLAELYREAAVFALSSEEEGLGIAALEAMASGVPVIATRCGGPETTVVDGETGFLVPRGDEGAFADRLRHMLSDPAARQRMGDAARLRVDQHFSLRKTGAAFLQAYDELLS